MTVSLIVPTYNCAAYLRRCLDSLLNQKCQEPYEIIVVNDASTDETKAILADYESRVRVIHLSEQRYMPAVRNVGLEVAKGDVVGTPDADCEYSPDFLRELLFAIKGVDWSHCNWKSILVNGKPHIGPRMMRDPTPHKLWWCRSNIGYHTCLFRRSALEGVGFGKPEWGRFELDRELCLYLAIKGKKNRYVPKVLMKNNERRDGITAYKLRNPAMYGERIASMRRRYADRIMPGTCDVVIPGINQKEMLLNSVDHYRRYSGVKWRLIYVDNGSTDGAPEAVEEYCREWNVDHLVLRMGTNTGFSHAVNEGIKAGNGQVVLIGNNDSWPGPQAIELLWKNLLPGVAVIGAVTDDNGINSLRKHAGFRRRGISIEKAREMSVEELAAIIRPFDTVIPSPMVAYNSILMKRSAVDKVGMLDEVKYADGLGADDDHCLRFRKAGMRVLRHQGSFFRHISHATFRSLGLNRRALQREAIAKFKG